MTDNASPARVVGRATWVTWAGRGQPRWVMCLTAPLRPGLPRGVQGARGLARPPLARLRPVSRAETQSLGCVGPTGSRASPAVDASFRPWCSAGYREPVAALWTKWPPAGGAGAVGLDTQWAVARCPATSAEETAHRLWGPRGSCRPSRGALVSTENVRPLPLLATPAGTSVLRGPDGGRLLLLR